MSVRIAPVPRKPPSAPTVEALAPSTGEPGLDPDLVAGVASWFVRSGRVAPGLAVDADGRARSWWWPLPTAEDRALLATLVGAANDVAAHQAAAGALAHAVDALVRTRLNAANVDLVGRAAGRRSTQELWLRSLTDPDPWLPETVDAAKAQALADEIAAWVRGALAGIGQIGVRLRIIEPTGSGPTWRVEALVHDANETSLAVPLAVALGPESPFAADTPEMILATLGRAVRAAPELSSLLAGDGAPASIDDAALVSLLTHRAGALAEAGISLLIPSWWTNRTRLGLRAKASKSDSSVTKASFGFDDIVTFRWEAALGDTKLTKADLLTLQRAADAKQTLVRLRGQWVEVRPDEIAALTRPVDEPPWSDGDRALMVDEFDGDDYVMGAVADAAQTDFLFYRALCDGSGRHAFARTYEEHLANACP